MKNYITNSLNRLSNNESGHAMLEFALISKFMIIFCLVGTIELTGLVQDHQKLTGVVAAAARSSSNFSGMYNGSVNTPITSAGCDTSDLQFSEGVSGVTRTSHNGLHKNICDMLHYSEYKNIQNPDLKIITEATCTDSGGGAICDQDRNIKVSMTVPYKGVFSYFFKGFEVTVTRVAPYMKPVQN